MPPPTDLFILLLEDLPSSWAGRIGIGLAALIICGAALYKFVTNYRKNKADGETRREEIVKRRIQDAVDLATATTKLHLEQSQLELGAAQKEIVTLTTRLNTCRETADRIETKANQVAKTNANILGQVEEIVRTVNEGCRHCGRPVFEFKRIDEDSGV